MKLTTQTLLTSAGLLSLLSIPALAQSEAYPVLRPSECGKTITPPSNGANGQYYLSKDCKTAYILPRELAPLRVSEFRTGASVQESDCKRSLDIETKLSRYEEELYRLEADRAELVSIRNKKMKDALPADAALIATSFKELIEETDRTIALQRKLVNDTVRRLPYSNFEGATLNFHTSLDLAKDVNAYREANPESGIVFQAAPISNGILSFGMADESSSEVGLASILTAKIPNLSASGDDVFADSRNVIVKGGASGFLKLSQPTVCKLIRNLSDGGFDEGLLTSESFSTAGFVANYIYDVPVTANVNFEFYASTKPENLFAAFKGKVEKGEFTQETISNFLLEGELKNNIKVKYEDGGLPQEVIYDEFENDPRLQMDSTHVYNYLFGHAMDMYLETVIEKMKSTSMIANSARTTIAPVEGGVRINNRVVTSCRWKTSWGRTRKKCKNYIEQDRFFVPGVATAENIAQDNSSVSFNFSVNKQTTIQMKHSTGFIRTARD